MPVKHESRQETERLMIEAMSSHLALLARDGLPVPELAEVASIAILDPAAA